MGSDASYWDKIWQSVSLDDYEFRCRYDPLRILLDKYLPNEGAILEGGCGPAHWLMYYRDKGYDIIGVEYAEDTVKRIKATFPDVPVYKGDIAQLDFPDNHFGAYYSGGVVEHFEEGPEKALREAHRVLKPGGLFLITVPYANISRRIVVGWHLRLLRRQSTPLAKRLDGRKASWTICQRPTVAPSPVQNYHFHEYIQSIPEFCHYLNEAGFDCEVIVPFSIKYGLRDYEFFRKAQQIRAEKLDSHGHQLPLQEQSQLSDANTASNSYWHRIMGMEQSTGILSGITVKALRAIFANMVLFVARCR